MANRDALRELQTRLAERLAQARTETQVAKWLAIECAGHGLLVPLPSAGEIFPVGSLVSVPHSVPWFMGVANLRGGLHGVVDLAAFLGLRAPLSQDTLKEGAQLLAINAQQGPHCAIFVDRLAGLRSAEQLTCEAADPGPRPAFAGPQWIDSEGRRWQEIDLGALARFDQFLAIAA